MGSTPTPGTRLFNLSNLLHSIATDDSRLARHLLAYLSARATQRKGISIWNRFCGIFPRSAIGFGAWKAYVSRIEQPRRIPKWRFDSRFGRNGGLAVSVVPVAGKELQEPFERFTRLCLGLLVADGPQRVGNG